MQYFFADEKKKKKFQKFSVRGCRALFGHQVQNNFFALIKKIFLQTLVEIIFRSKLSKKGALSSFLKEFLENIKK